jgi:hypothetical protein
MQYVWTGQPDSLVVIAAATKKAINDLHDLNPVKLGVLQGSVLFYFCVFSKSLFISDAPEKPLFKVNIYGTLIVSYFIIFSHVQTFSKHGDSIHCFTNYPKSM